MHCLVETNLMSSQKRMQFLHVHLLPALSDNKQTASSTLPAKDRDGIVSLSNSISNILLHFSGLGSIQCRTFGLRTSTDGGLHTLIFVNDLRLDLLAHTVIADACVLPLTRAIIEMAVVRNILKMAVANRSVAEIMMVNKEAKAWKQMLPVLAERCREWRHTSNCEYITSGIPASTDSSQSPLCSCGRGKAVPPLFMKSEWKALAPLVTRIAFAPLFDTSSRERFRSVLTRMQEIKGADGRASINVGQANGECVKCGSRGKPKLMRSSQCQGVEYCSKVCQTEHWKIHKHFCRMLHGKAQYAATTHMYL